jgi:hypothetical protein
MDGCGDGALGVGDQLALGHPLAAANHGRGGAADVLLQRHMEQGR